MDDKDKKEKKKLEFEVNDSNIGVGMCLGVAMGSLVGMLTHHLVFGMCIGLALGPCIGMMFGGGKKDGETAEKEESVMNDDSKEE